MGAVDGNKGTKQANQVLQASRQQQQEGSLPQTSHKQQLRLVLQRF